MHTLVKLSITFKTSIGLYFTKHVLNIFRKCMVHNLRVNYLLLCHYLGNALYTFEKDWACH